MYLFLCLQNLLAIHEEKNLGFQLGQFQGRGRIWEGMCPPTQSFNVIVGLCSLILALALQCIVLQYSAN